MQSADLILNYLKSSFGFVTPRDYIKTFRAIISAEIEFLGDNAGLTRPMRNMLQQQSILRGLKGYAFETIDGMKGESEAVKPLVKFIRKTKMQTFLAEDTSAYAIDEAELENLARIGFVHYDETEDKYIIPPFLFDALCPDSPSSDFTARGPVQDAPTLEKATSGFVKLRFDASDGPVKVMEGARKVRLSSDAYEGVAGFAARKRLRVFDFYVWALRNGDWLIETSRPCFPGTKFKAIVTSVQADETRCQPLLGLSDGTIEVELLANADISVGAEVEVVLRETASRSGSWAAVLDVPS